jgi:GMP synthase PP-ATPase subunit
MVDGGAEMNEAKTLNEIRKIGIIALAKALGPIGMVRFIQSFDLGSGDYTKERYQWLDQSIDEIIEEIKRKRHE